MSDSRQTAVNPGVPYDALAPPADRFSLCLGRVLVYEGGLTDDAADRGGLTNLGITDAEFRRWLASRGMPPRSVRDIARGEAALIYRGSYWLPSGADVLPPGPDFAVFDCAVNQGVGEARVIAARIDARADVGADPAGWVTAYLDDREAVYHRIVEHDPSQAGFLRGWLNRAADVRAKALADAAAAATARPDAPAACSPSPWVLLLGDGARVGGLVCPAADPGHAYAPARELLERFVGEARTSSSLDYDAARGCLTWDARPVPAPTWRDSATGDAWVQVAALIAWLGLALDRDEAARTATVRRPAAPAQ